MTTGSPTDPQMDFAFSDDQQAMIDLAAKILRDTVTHDSLRELEASGAPFHVDAWQQLVDSGLTGVCISEANGGAGLGLSEALAILVECGRVAAPVPLLPSIVLAAQAIDKFGSDQQQAWVRDAITGQRILTVALAEDNAPDPAIVGTTAVRTGAGWRLQGTKTAVLVGPAADLVLVPATTAGQTLVFVVDVAADGINVESQTGTDHSVMGRIVLDGLEIPADRILGPTDASHVFDWLLATGTLGVCAQMAGAADRALQLTGEYARERKQFGKTLSFFQGVTQRAGDAYIQLQAMKLTLWQASWKLETTGSADMEVPVARYWASRGGHFVAFAASHIHGGTGFDRDYPLYHYFLMCRQLDMTLGSENQQLATLGQLLAVPGINLGEAF